MAQANYTLDYPKKLARDKRSSLFFRAVSDEEANVFKN
jgi:hypothetical protein